MLPDVPAHPDSAEAQNALAELAKLPIARQLGAEQLAHLATLAKFEPAAAGAILQREQAPVDALRIIISGRIALTLVLPQGVEAPVSTVSRGELIGWSSLLGGGPASMRAQAVKPTQCLVVPRDALLEAFDRDPSLGYHLTRHALQVVVDRLHDAHVQLLDLFRNGHA
jgi:CRP-like cAMP-binding protein